ncbi:MAG: exodeoxyribonuclease VII small subunit [Firmicutes bacterium]|nr:exodeoxyribonuclease VII small subunit [Bacillota bacterium]
MSENKIKENLKFDEALEKLESVLTKLESNDCPLEDALSLFQEGMELLRFCQEKLNDVENKISILLKDTEQFVPFSGEGE